MHFVVDEDEDERQEILPANLDDLSKSRLIYATESLAESGSLSRLGPIKCSGYANENDCCR